MFPERAALSKASRLFLFALACASTAHAHPLALADEKWRLAPAQPVKWLEPAPRDASRLEYQLGPDARRFILSWNYVRVKMEPQRATLTLQIYEIDFERTMIPASWFSGPYYIE